jgi:hypothetical protein
MTSFPKEEAALAAIGKKLNSIDVPFLPKSNKLCFICCNTYMKPAYQLGAPPLNDSYKVAKAMRELFDYTILYLHNSSRALFLKWANFILQNFKGSLLLFYTGHGKSIRDTNNDEADGCDEAMVFDDGLIVDDELRLCLSHSVCARTVLLSDCCHSGSIWDLQSKGAALPPNIMSISASGDSQTAKQLELNGLFTLFFWDFIIKNKKITGKQLSTELNKRLDGYQQHCTIATTTPSMLDAPIFT